MTIIPERGVLTTNFDFPKHILDFAFFADLPVSTETYEELWKVQETKNLD